MRKIEAVLVDDLDGSRDAKTVEFAVGNDKWSLDLSPKHERELRRSMKKFIEAAQKASNPGPARGVPTAQSPERQEFNQRVRAWAVEHKIEDVPTRGRIPKRILDQYEEYERNHTNVG